MSWILPVAVTLVLFSRVESGREPLRSSTELFWQFCAKPLSPEQIERHIEFEKDYRARRVPASDSLYYDPEIERLELLALEHPEMATAAVIQKLFVLASKHRVPYAPDEQDDPIRLYVHTHLEATRLIYLLNTEGFSERTREVLDAALNALTRLQNRLGPSPYLETPWSFGYGKCLGNAEVVPLHDEIPQSKGGRPV